MNLEYMKVPLFEISKKKKKLFHNIQFFWDVPVYNNQHTPNERHFFLYVAALMAFISAYQPSICSESLTLCKTTEADLKLIELQFFGL